MLRNARERKGLDLSTAARKLRIRPDILRAIEDGDFARMPPRGYTSNMVGAYARLVGLNPSEVTRAYRDEAYQFETGRRPYDRPERGRSSDRGGEWSSGRGGSASRSSRRTETLEMPSNRSSRSRGAYGASSGRSSRGAAPQPQYTNLVQGRQAPGITANFGSMLPLIIVGAIIVALLVLVIVLAFGNRGGEAEDTPTIPISGMANPAGTDTGSGDANNTTPSVEPVAPTSAKFTWEVLDGKEAYIEIYKDDKTIMAETVTGPDTGDEDVTDTLRFVTSSPENVKIFVDDKEVTLPEPSDRGISSYTVNFEDILDQWRKDNNLPSSSKADDADNAKSNSDEGSSSSDEEGSSGSDETGSSDDADTSDSDTADDDTAN